MSDTDSLEQSTLNTPPPDGTRRVFDGVERVFYEGYWIKTYPAPANSLEAKKRLIEALTRRLFNHTEHGLNIPGTRLAEARNSPGKRARSGAAAREIGDACRGAVQPGDRYLP